MTKKELTAAVDTAKEETRAAMQAVYNALNPGQQKLLLKDEYVKEMFDLYGVEYREG